MHDSVPEPPRKRGDFTCSTVAGGADILDPACDSDETAVTSVPFGCGYFASSSHVSLW